MSRTKEWVSASELGSLAYCEKAFALQKVQGVASDRRGRGRMRSGTRNHHRHGVRYDWQRALFRWAWRLAAVAAATAALWAWGLS